MYEFWGFMQERQRMYLRKQRGLRVLTQDPVLAHFSFTNVYREQDKTTVWLAEHVRNPQGYNIDYLLYVIPLYRWFNRIDVMEQIATGHDNRQFPWTVHDLNMLEHRLRAWRPKGPWTTGAYIINTPAGMDKLAGVIYQAKALYADRNRIVRIFRDEDMTLEKATALYSEYEGLSGFMSYEIVTDLRHTSWLGRASDIMTWANPGPGCRRGLNRVFGRDVRMPVQEPVEEMQFLLQSNLTPLWLEMRDIEHTLCEFDKYSRAHLGEGRPRTIFRRKL